MERTKEEPYDGGYSQYFTEGKTTTRIFTHLPWDDLELRMRDYYVERAEEYFRVRHHTDLGRISDG
jgi:hypothetical protein